MTHYKKASRVGTHAVHGLTLSRRRPALRMVGDLLASSPSTPSTSPLSPRSAHAPRGGGGAEKSPSRPSLSFLATAALFWRIHEFTVPKVPVFLVAPPLFGEDILGGPAALVALAAAAEEVDGCDAAGDHGSGAPGADDGAGGGGGGCCGVVSHSIPLAISRFVACSRSFASAIALRADAFIGALTSPFGLAAAPSAVASVAAVGAAFEAAVGFSWLGGLVGGGGSKEPAFP